MQELSFSLIFILLLSCTSQKSEEPNLDWETTQDSSQVAFTITGLDGPEAVRFDPDQNVYFISNFTGGGNTQDSTGFITKADAEGNVINREFMTGTESFPLHAPRGMFIVDETLWAADVLGVHGFNKNTGEQTEFIDFTQFEIGFLNDISADEESILYVTDTGTAQVFKVEDGEPSLFLDSLNAAPNGITLNPENGEFLLAPWGGSQLFSSFDRNGKISQYGNIEGGYFDGIEFVSEMLLMASQQDSSLRIYDGINSKILIKTPGRPADIGINTNLHHVAVPYIALDRVDIWNLNKK